MTFRSEAIAPQDLLDAARTIPMGTIGTCHWLDRWIPAARLLEWSRRGLEEGDEYGLSNALTYAKRAVANRIDVLIRYNHLTPFARAGYHDKVRALQQIGVRVPGVVHDHVLDPRNQLEHEYRIPDGDTARHASEIAELFVTATDPEYGRSSIVAVNWNVMGSQAIGPFGVRIAFQGFGNDPMLFIDVFGEPHAAKIVDPSAGEIRYAPMSSFSDDQATALARLLRENYSQSSLYERSNSTPYFEEMKRQGGVLTPEVPPGEFHMHAVCLPGVGSVLRGVCVF